jgi:Reverse transcriptase (RNA-dependent DNA polymerase)
LRNKDPNDPTKLRPISMGSALRRIAGKYIMTVYGPSFAEYLLPQGQYGIALNGGLQLMVDCARAQLHRYLEGPHPTRALLLLDLKNMFNCVSRQALRDTLQANPQFSPLTPFFDLLYNQPNTCYYQDSTGALGTFTQEEGVAQGCPLRPVGACLVLHQLKTALQPTTDTMATSRINHGDQGDDGRGTQSHTSSYMDDTSTFLHPKDIIPFLQHFHTLGAPLGLHLNLAKTKLLTTTTGVSVRDQPTTPHTSQPRPSSRPSTTSNNKTPTTQTWNSPQAPDTLDNHLGAQHSPQPSSTRQPTHTPQTYTNSAQNSATNTPCSFSSNRVPSHTFSISSHQTSTTTATPTRKNRPTQASR